MQAMMSALDIQPFRRRLGKGLQANQRRQQHQTRQGSLRHPIRQVRTTPTTAPHAAGTGKPAEPRPHKRSLSGRF